MISFLKARKVLIARFDPTDINWGEIQSLLRTKMRGVRRAEDRKVLNGTFRRLRTGAHWADISARYRPATSRVNRFNRWRHVGHWTHVFQGISSVYGGFICLIDSSTIRVHQHGANSPKKGGRSVARQNFPPDHLVFHRTMSRSPGRLTTKTHALVDVQHNQRLTDLDWLQSESD